MDHDSDEHHLKMRDLRERHAEAHNTGNTEVERETGRQMGLPQFNSFPSRSSDSGSDQGQYDDLHAALRDMLPRRQMNQGSPVSSEASTPRPQVVEPVKQKPAWVSTNKNDYSATNKRLGIGGNRTALNRAPLSQQ